MCGFRLKNFLDNQQYILSKNYILLPSVDLYSPLTNCHICFPEPFGTDVYLDEWFTAFYSARYTLILYTPYMYLFEINYLGLYFF